MSPSKTRANAERHDSTLRLWIQIVRLANTLQKDVDTKLRKNHGQSLSRFDVLSQLERVDKHELPVGQLSNRLITQAANISRLLDRMEADGLLRRKNSSNDRRSVTVCATPLGLSVFAQMAHDNDQWIGQAFQSLTPDQMQQLGQTLREVEPTVKS